MVLSNEQIKEIAALALAIQERQIAAEMVIPACLMAEVAIQAIRDIPSKNTL